MASFACSLFAYLFATSLVALVLMRIVDPDDFDAIFPAQDPCARAYNAHVIRRRCTYLKYFVISGLVVAAFCAIAGTTAAQTDKSAVPDGK